MSLVKLVETIVFLHQLILRNVIVSLIYFSFILLQKPKDILSVKDNLCIILMHQKLDLVCHLC